MKICVIGMGYIGLPTALLFAKAGNEVVGIDIDNDKIQKLDQGELPFKEKNLLGLYEQAKQNFNASGDFDYVSTTDVVIVCVPTPMKDKKMEGKFVFQAIHDISRKLEKETLVVLESTVKPGTTKEVKRILQRETGFKEFSLAYCPERAIPGNTIEEMVKNDRVIGGIDKKSSEKAKELYSCFVEGTMYVTDSTTAEMVKLAENTYRDVNIALANELALVSEINGTNVNEVIKLANKHPRVNIHQPGIGVGGHCLPIDPWFLVENYPQAKIIPTARQINNAMTERIAKIVSDKGIKKVTIFGSSYKPNVDDTRESPSKKLKELLEKKGVQVNSYDPVVHKEQKLKETVKSSECIILSTAHDEFRGIDWKEISKLLSEPKLLIDGRNFFGKKPEGFTYYAIGKGGE